MPNALTSGLPPAPMPQQQEPQQGAPQQQQQQAPQAPPVLSHQQAVAALRHFHAIAQELRTFLKDPDLGRSDLKSSIIDGTTTLVSDRIVSPGTAVAMLATVPEKPRDQKKWVEEHYQQNIQAQRLVLDHHRAGGPDTGDWSLESQAQGPDPDDHMKTMNGITALYKGRNDG